VELYESGIQEAVVSLTEGGMYLVSPCLKVDILFYGLVQFYLQLEYLSWDSIKTITQHMA
jgi:hypothetical protein